MLVFLLIAVVVADAKSLCGNIGGGDPYEFIVQRVVRSTDSDVDVSVKQALVKYLVADAVFNRVCVKSGRLIQDEDEDGGGDGGAAAGALDNTNVLTGVRRILANVFTGNLIGVIQESVGLRSPEGVSNVFTDVLSTIFGSNATAGVTGILANATSSTPAYNGSVAGQQGMYPGQYGQNINYQGAGQYPVGQNLQYGQGIGQYGQNGQYLGNAGVNPAKVTGGSAQYPAKVTGGSAQYTGTVQFPSRNTQQNNQYNPQHLNSIYSAANSGSSYSLGGRRRRKTTQTPEFQEYEEDEENKA